MKYTDTMRIVYQHKHVSKKVPLDVEDCFEELLRQQSYAIKIHLIASKASSLLVL